MARYVLPIAGAVVGGVFGGPLGAQLGWAIGSALGGIVDPQVIKGPSIGDIAQQTSQEGVPRPIVHGLSQPMAGNIIATSPPNIVRRRERQGKGGPKVETESVYRTYAIRICEGPIGGVVRVWRNNQLVYDVSDNQLTSGDDNDKFLENARFFLGTFDQNPSPDLEAVFGVGTTPAHRGTAYMVMANEDLTDLRGAIPTYQFQVSQESGGAALVAICATGAGGQRAARSIDGGETWTLVDTPFADVFTDVAWHALAYSPTLRRIVAVGDLSGTSPKVDTMYSDDAGLTWVGLDSGVEAGAANNWMSLIWVPDDGGFFLAASNAASGSASPNMFRKSVDGITWTAIPVDSPVEGVGDVCYSPELQRLVAIVTRTPNVTDVIYSDDFGETWTRVALGILWGLGGFGTKTGGIDWDPERGQFVFGGASGSSFTPPKYAVSPTGLAGTWTQGDTPFDNNTEVLQITYMPNLLGMIATSRANTGTGQDGGVALYTTAFGAQTFPLEDTNWFGVAYDSSRNRAMMVGTRSGASDKFAYKELNSDPWTMHDLPANRTWTDVAACVGAAGTVRLVDLIAAICERAGMSSDMYDTSELDGEIEVRGMTIINTYPAYAALQALSQIYFFVPSYYDGVLHFIPSGGDSVATITEDDMVDDHDIEIEESLRDDPISVPRVMHLVYYDVNGGLATDKQTSERAGDYRSLGEQSIQSSVMMDADTAAQAVSINHKVAVENLRGTLKFCLPDNWIRLVPSNPVIVQWQGLSKRVRLTKVEILDGYQQYEALHDRQSAYTSEVEGIPAAEQTAPPSNVVGPTLIEPLDIHIVRDADDAAGLIYYVAISGTLPAWTGALVELSLDGGANYVESLSSTTDTIMGSLSAPLQDHPQAFPDETNTLSVTISTPYAEFEETDLEGLLNRRNFAIVGNEIIQFAEANEVSPGEWELSLMLRGRKGTQTNYWPAGTRFVMLDTASLGVIPSSLLDIGRTLTFRATSFGETADTATVTSMVYAGRSQIEREPAYLQARLDGTDAIIEWQGVGRLGGGALVAHGVRFAGYRVTLTGANAVVISVDTDEQSLTQDVSTLTQPIHITVCQLNDLTGEGPEIELYI